MFYQKNLPIWEQLIRIAVGVGLIGYAWAGHLPFLAALILTVTAITLVATGFFGFCPACALLGRKVKSQRE
ncbi:MAG: YgaP family membrane protein [Candidatus Dormibacteraceae bacterium]